MPVTHDDFLNSASDIAANCSGEMAQRNALSRTYYATYHKLINIIAPDRKVRCGMDGKPLGMHKNYIEQLSSEPAKSLPRRIGVKMSTLYQSRLTADYKPALPIAASTFSVNIGLAKDVFTLADQLAATGSSVMQGSHTPPNTVSTVGAPLPSNTQARPKLLVVK